MKAPVNKIIEISNVDGPGSRMSIFFQGCNFSCLYCHNPETINMCNNCGECVEGCPSGALTINNKIVEYDFNKCINCDQCISVCRFNSSPKIRMLSVDEILVIIKKYQPLIRGITVSGGECMLYANFLTKLFKEVQKLGLTCLIDSNGSIDFGEYEELLKYTNGVMLDVKVFNKAFHKKIIGNENNTVLNNLKYLNEKSKLYEVRTVLLPTFPEINKETIKRVCQVIDSSTRYKLINYRSHGVRKEGKEFLGVSSLNEAQLKKYKEYAEDLGHREVIII